MKVLMVLTSHDQLGNTGRKTGFWLGDFAAPYYTFRDAGAAVTLASPSRRVTAAATWVRSERPPEGARLSGDCGCEVVAWNPTNLTG